MLKVRLLHSLLVGCSLLASSFNDHLIAQQPAAKSEQHSAWRNGPAWQQFADQHGNQWQVEWSNATATPKSLWGSGIPLVDWRTNSLVEARRHAHQVLLDNAELLGIGDSDFRESIGARMHRVWTFKFQQYYRELEVIGGRADVRVHMVGRVPMIGSTFWPIPVDFVTTPTIEPGNAWLLAWSDLGELPSNAAQPTPFAPPRLVIWGDIHASGPVPVHLAWEVSVSNIKDSGDGKVGRYYIDGHSGKVLTFVSDKHECGFVGCNLASHRPVDLPALPLPAPVNTLVTVMGWTRLGIDAGTPLSNVPMPGLELNVPGIGAVVTDANGQFTIDISSAVSISVGSLNGRHHGVISGTAAPNNSYVVNPGVATTIQLLTPGASINQAAHTTTSWWVDATNEFARSILGNSPQIATASNMGVTINIASTCNAYYTGNTINFYQAGGGCSNTAFSTVIAHEWGHGLDDRYGGISQVNGLSEGWGDILGCYLVDSPALGSGFLSAGVPLRDANNTTQYPCSGCGVHTAGQSWMGFAWKLRERLATTMGNRNAAIALSNNIVISTIAADATDQLGAVREVFIADDDDGNLANGTPNYTDLVWACDQHSLPYPGQSSSVPNDECVDAILLVDGVNGSFSSTGAFTSSPSWSCASGGNDVWFSYVSSGNGTLTVSTCGLATYDSAIQMFSGSCGSLTSVACNDDTCALQSTASATVSAGVYYIRVGGYSGATGSFSLSVSGPAAPPAVPSAPTGLGATAVGATQVNLSWTDTSNDETGFQVQRSTSGAAFSTIASLGANSTSYNDTGRSPSTLYAYRVRAVNGAGNSSYSNTASATTDPAVPSAPTGLGANAVGSDQINLAWTDNSSDETGFDIERSANGSAFGTIATMGANSTSFSDTGRSPSSTYSYRVRAVNGAGGSSYSNVATATTGPAAPSAPSGLSATAVSSTEVSLAWADTSGDETGFEVQRSTSGAGFSTVATLAVNATSYSDAGRSPSTTYAYRVRAVNAGGNSAYSNTASVTTNPPPPTAPSAPTGLGATAIGVDQVDLAWTDTASNETGFEVERSTNGSPFAVMAALGANSSSYSDTGRSPNTLYAYRVRAFNAVGNSAYSNTASATTDPAAPTAPTGLGATAVGSDQIDLVWTDTSSDEAGFEVQRSNDGAAFLTVATLAADSTDFSDGGRLADTSYSYRVRAVNSGGNSSFSNTATATTDPASVQTFVATALRSSHGVVTGTLAMTTADDGVYQELKERTRNRRNSLKFEYRITNVPTSGLRTLRLQAHRTVSPDNDTFRVQVRNQGSWVQAMVITKQVDDNVYQEFVLPSTVGRTVRVRIIDSNNTRDAVGEDTVFVDQVIVEVQ